jgi:hypothetical protein
MKRAFEGWKKNTQPVTHDFEVLLKYVEIHRPALTPVQGLIPVKHVLNMMEHFLVKEVSEEKVGAKVFKKRFEDEFPRFYFLDLLAAGSRILSTGRGRKITPGKYFKKYFELPPFYRPAALFQNFCFSFNLEAWFSGGDFGTILMGKAPLIWRRIFPWIGKKEVAWEEWAKRVIKECSLTWTLEKKDYSESLLIWGLQTCFIEPLSYLGIVERYMKDGKYGPELHAVRLTAWGSACLKELENKMSITPPPKPGLGAYSLN